MSTMFSADREDTETTGNNVRKDSLIKSYYGSKEDTVSPRTRYSYAVKEKTFKIINNTCWVILALLYLTCGSVAVAVIHGIISVRNLLNSLGYEGEDNVGRVLELSEQAGGSFLNQLPVVYENKNQYIIVYIVIPFSIVIILTIIFLICRYFLERKLFN